MKVTRKEENLKKQKRFRNPRILKQYLYTWFGLFVSFSKIYTVGSKVCCAHIELFHTQKIEQKKRKHPWCQYFVRKSVFEMHFSVRLGIDSYNLYTSLLAIIFQMSPTAPSRSVNSSWVSIKAQIVSIRSGLCADNGTDWGLLRVFRSITAWERWNGTKSLTNLYPSSWKNWSPASSKKWILSNNLHFSGALMRRTVPS